MLNSAQVGSLQRRLAIGDLVDSHDGLPLDRVDVSLRDEGETVASEPAASVRMRGPEFVLGVAEDSSCLTGVADATLTVPEKRVRRFSDARVIGWRSLLSRRGFFSSAQNYLHGDSGEFFATAHEGFAACGAGLHHVSSSSPRLVMGGDTLFLSGLEAGNYGSFLFRFLPKLLLFRELGMHFDRVVVPDRSSFVSQAAQWAGFGEAQLISVREAVSIVFERLYVADDFEAEGALCASTRKRLESLISRRADRSVEGRRIYISRYLSSGYRPGYRPLRNELEIQRTMTRLGFEVAYPELMSFEQQIATFAQARMLVGPSGSGMLNAMFAPDGCGVLDLESYTTTVRQHAKIYGSCGHRYGFCFGRYADDREVPGFMRAWTVDPALVAAGLERLW